MARLFVVQDLPVEEAGQCALCAYPLAGRGAVAADRPDICFCLPCFTRCVDVPGGLKLPASGMRVVQVDRRGEGFSRV